MSVYIDQSVVPMVLSAVVDVLKIADRHWGECMGKFAYDVLSRIDSREQCYDCIS